MSDVKKFNVLFADENPYRKDEKCSDLKSLCTISQEEGIGVKQQQPPTKPLLQPLPLQPPPQSSMRYPVALSYAQAPMQSPPNQVPVQSPQAPIQSSLVQIHIIIPGGVPLKYSPNSVNPSLLVNCPPNSVNPSLLVNCPPNSVNPSLLVNCPPNSVNPSPEKYIPTNMPGATVSQKICVQSNPGPFSPTFQSGQVNESMIKSTSVKERRETQEEDETSVVWYWEIKDKWNPYSKELITVIEKAYKSGRPSVTVNIGSSSYVIDFTEMTQECQDRRGALRKVKRKGPPRGVSVSDWEYETRDGWVSFGSHIASKLDVDHANGHSCSQFVSINNKQYTIDFKNMMQENKETGRKRRVRKVDPNNEKGRCQQFVWEWNTQQTWKEYDNETQNILESSFKANEETVTIEHMNSHYGPYVLNLKNWTQTNNAGKTRKIRRREFEERYVTTQDNVY